VRSRPTLRHWIQKLLRSGRCAEAAARLLLEALQKEFTTNLSQLGRLTDRLLSANSANSAKSAKSARQRFSRWLKRSPWQAEQLFSRLLRVVRPLLERRAREERVLLLVDPTLLSDQWVVFQVSCPWQGRALPLYRAVYPYTGAQRAPKAMLKEALAFLARSLPGRRDRYVLLLDRDFASHPIIQLLQQGGWRFVLRVKSSWLVTHPQYQGKLQGTVAAGLVGETPLLLAGAVLGDKDKGRARYSQAHVVLFHGAGHKAPWYLVTTEPAAAGAVALYRQRMKIEAQFRDLKGPFGLDKLAAWQSGERVGAFLAWVAAYEWRLAYLWVVHWLAEFAERLRVWGRLSWIRVAREWVRTQQWLTAAPPGRCL